VAVCLKVKPLCNLRTEGKEPKEGVLYFQRIHLMFACKLRNAKNVFGAAGGEFP
jgi:hypothetical protein